MVRISADSTCDLSSDIIKRFNIEILPLYIIIDDKELRDGVDVTPADIFKYVDSTGKLCKTAAAGVSDYYDLFSRITSNGDSVVHINISSEFSVCHQNAVLAAKEFENVYLVDSRNLSTGSGHIVMEAALMAEQDLPAETIKQRLDELVGRVEASFVVERLDYLYKGGRCSSLAALGGNILGLKPCIEVKDGKMGVGKKYRGSFDSALRKYVRDRLEGRDDIVYDRIFITHPACTPEIVDSVRKSVEKYGDFKEIIETRAGCTISNHCGPFTLGVLFIRKK